MKRKSLYLLICLLVGTTGLFAQFGIKAGVNMANEIKSFSQTDIKNAFSSENLTGYQIGLTYQFMPKKSGLGCEIGALLTQKGSAFNDSLNTDGAIKIGYNELNYVEVPFNLRYRLTLGFIGIYGTAGIYGGYALSGKTVDETTNTTEIQSFQTFMDHLDYGWNLGAGVELFKKIQFGATWSEGLKDTSVSNPWLPTPKKASNRVFSLNLVYLF
jgi:opacity protein-like surface antigen